MKMEAENGVMDVPMDGTPRIIGPPRQQEKRYQTDSSSEPSEVTNPLNTLILDCEKETKITVFQSSTLNTSDTRCVFFSTPSNSPILSGYQLGAL